MPLILAPNDAWLLDASDGRSLVEDHELRDRHDREEEKDDQVEFQLTEVDRQARAELLLNLSKLPRRLSEAQLA